MMIRFKQHAKELKLQSHLIDAALDLFNGIYLITPFLRYELTAELAIYTRQRASELRRNNYVENIIN